VSRTASCRSDASRDRDTTPDDASIFALQTVDFSGKQIAVCHCSGGKLRLSLRYSSYTGASPASSPLAGSQWQNSQS